LLLQPAIVNPNTRASNNFMISLLTCFEFMHCEPMLRTISLTGQFVPLTKVIGNGSVANIQGIKIHRLGTV
jgi:hypothetical protein